MPDTTCNPWVSRYSHTGRVGQKNHGCGCWMKWLNSPVKNRLARAHVAARLASTRAPTG
jgi:hypothetical protein